ncbi:hypothetical protein K456DRAFT_31424 [Colletotrichum gloeosporioides 23]|nr:hypothetical protein K456DRAFT_31424 [Colletotrichum gloeosporioides 23]
MQFSRDAIDPAAAVTQTNPRHVLHDERASKHAQSFGTTLFERKQLQTTHLNFDPICSRTLWGSRLPSSRAPRTFRTSRFAACYLLVINYDPDSLDNGVQSQPARSETFCHRLPLRIEAFAKRITLGLHCPVPLRSQDKRTFPPIPPSHASTTEFPSASGETFSASAHGSLLPPASPTPKTSQRAQPPQDPTILPVCGLPTRAMSAFWLPFSWRTPPAQPAFSQAPGPRDGP